MVFIGDLNTFPNNWIPLGGSIIDKENCKSNSNSVFITSNIVLYFHWNFLWI